MGAAFSKREETTTMSRSGLSAGDSGDAAEVDNLGNDWILVDTPLDALQQQDGSPLYEWRSATPDTRPACGHLCQACGRLQCGRRKSTHENHYCTACIIHWYREKYDAERP
ncbi:unnamed protein product [Symbiodinium natans]|uniref:Uncharacterized protein n=1 Tax=Symbiodinium natans TaxID=878477 RepID=A0A812SFL4_9DINO|nr:unnamed protein product [Symbiodinium natans]